MSLEPVQSNEHSVRVKAKEECSLLAAVEHILGQPGPEAAGRARALELLQLGAVYVGRPQKGQPAVVKWVRSTELEEAATVAVVPAGHLVRVHTQPKRFPACHRTDWPQRVLHACDEYVVIDKPAGVLCMRHESNAVEEVAAVLSGALGLPGLEVCHRLDQWTTGVLVLSRTKDANRALKAALSSREPGLAKTYKALTARPVPLGTHTHHMYDGPFDPHPCPVLRGGKLRARGPRLLAGGEGAAPDAPPSRWQRCELEVLECRPHLGAHEWCRKHLVPAASASESTASASNPPPSASAPPTPPAAPAHPAAPPTTAAPATLYESTVLLHTGRTHQVRAQLAALGCPLMGDEMYGPIAGLLVGGDGLLPDDPDLISTVESVPQLEGPIGLHAWRLTWRGWDWRAEPGWGPE